MTIQLRKVGHVLAEVMTKFCLRRRLLCRFKVFERPSREVTESVRPEIIIEPSALRGDIDCFIKDRRILLVEDSQDSQMLMKKLLEKEGAYVDLADNGQDGLKKALDSAFDIILMDVQMPLKDGLSATRELRSMGYEGLIVALSAMSLKDEISNIVKAGFDAYLVKPLRKRELVCAIAKIAEAFGALQVKH